MYESRGTDVTAIILSVVIVIVLLAAGGAFVWQRQLTLVQTRRVLAEEAQARAVTENLQAQTVHKEIDSMLRANDIETSPGSFKAEIRKVLQTQQQAWNAGNIDRFMAHYWKSDQLTFSSGGKVTRGWQNTLENYKKRYPSRKQMGKLSFENLEFSSLGKESALVLGEWQLDREPEYIGGNFTLAFRRLDGKWVIIHDHTSRNEQP